MTWLWLIAIVIVLLFGLVVFRGSPYVPSRKIYIRQALTELYKLTPDDTLVDIGSGDGVVLREAAKIGARAVGFEINPLLVLISRFSSRKDSKVSVHLADFWLAPLPDDTTVVYVFSVTRDIKNIIKRIQNETNRLNHPVHIISYGNDLMGMKALKKVSAYSLYIFNPKSKYPKTTT